MLHFFIGISSGLISISLLRGWQNQPGSGQKHGNRVTSMNIRDFARIPQGLLLLVLGIILAAFNLANLYFNPVQCVDDRLSPGLVKAKWDEDTMENMADHLREDMLPNSVSQELPPKVPLGSDAFWALESTRDFLKENVATARQHFLKTLGEVKKYGEWNSTNGQPGFTRAVIVFMPGNLQRPHSRQFRALFLSWVRMRLEQPRSFKTDLIVATPEENLKRLLNVGCTQDIRNNSSQSERCIIRLYQPLIERRVEHFTASDPLTEYDGFVDSVLCLAEFDSYHYDAVMRSDLDTLLMPGFADWTPPSRKTLVVGEGGYGNENANAHLNYVSMVLGLDIKEGLDGVGSTWFGDTRLMVACARLTINVMRWLHTQEFSTYEKSGMAGALSWPHWHWWALSMYGGHVALNQVGSSTSVVVSSGKNGRMDYSSTSVAKTSDRSIKHVHCWHTDDMFSKFQFGLGKYDDMDFTDREEMATVQDYVALTAMSSIRLSDEELSRLALDDTYAKSRQNWMRSKSAEVFDMV